MTRFRPLVFVVVLLAAVAARAAVSEFTLDNGLKLLVKEDHRAPVVVTQVWYKVGSSYEHAGITGVSHALEHMMFKGTAKHPAGEFSRIIEMNGGSENAFTGADYTAYFQVLEKSRLAVSLELEADRMRNLTLPPAEFDKEIKVVKEERRWRTDDEPQDYTLEALNATAFETSPYRQPIIGWMADLDHMTVRKVHDWYQRWYAPNNAIVVVAGDVQPQAVHDLVQKYFGDLKPEKVRPPQPRPEVPQSGIKRITVKRPAEVPYLVMAWKAPVLTGTLGEHPQVQPWEPYALEVLTGVLDGGSSARFAAQLVRGSEVAAEVSADYQGSSRLPGLFTVDGTPGQGHDIADLEQAVRAQLEKLKTDLVDDAELERVKAQVVSQNIYRKDSVFFQAMVLGTFEAVGLPWQWTEQYVDHIQQVTPEQVRDVARRYLVDDHLTVGVLDPQPVKPGQPIQESQEHGYVR